MEPCQLSEILDALQVRDVHASQLQLGAGIELRRGDGAAGILAQQVGAEVRVREVGAVDRHVGTGCQRRQDQRKRQELEK